MKTIKEVAQEVIEKNLPAYTTMKNAGFDSGEDMETFWKEFDRIMEERQKEVDYDI